MHSHSDAHLWQRWRRRLVIQHLQRGSSLAELAAENRQCFAEAFGYGIRCAIRQLARYRSDGVPSLANRLTQLQTLDPQKLQEAVNLRHQNRHLRHIVRLLAAPFSAVASALNKLGLGRLRNLEPKPPEQRYAWELLGDLVHIDVKTQARIRKVGHRITGDREKRSPTGVGYYKVHVAIVEGTQLAYVDVLEDEQKPTVINFLTRALA